MKHLILSTRWSDLIGLGQILGAVLIMLLAGRLLLRGREGPAVQMMAGWGALSLILTLWGVAGIGSLAAPAILFCLLALGGLAIWRRGEPGDLAAIGRVVALALPILIITATMRPSQSDIFLNLMPNAAYLVDHGVFPAEGGPPSYSFLPVAPYNTQFVPYLGSFLGGGFAAGGLALFTILLHLAAGLLFARVLAGPRAGWAATAFGLLLATAFNPGFVPRTSFAGYGEAPLAVALAFAAWLGLAAMEKLARGTRWPAELVPLALVLAALVNTKQQALGLFLAFLMSALLVAAWDRRIGWRAGLRAVAAAGAPGALLYLAWRYYVLERFPEGELKPLPISQWQWGNLPEIALSMAKVVIEKPFFFATVLLMFALLLRAWRQRRSAETVRALGLGSAVFLAYNAFIVLTYIGHFPGEMSVEAHSYFRYNTQLSLIILLALVLGLRAPIETWLATRPVLTRRAGMALVVLMLLVPVGFAQRLRFDADMPQPLVWSLAEHLSPHLAPDGKVALLLPGDGGSVAPMLRGILRFSPPRHPDLDILELTNGNQSALDQAAQAGYDLALISCSDGSDVELPAHSAVLLQRRDGAWRTVESWPYAPVPPKQRWSQSLSWAPLCRG
ncbi:MAG TPA: hypothetical protein VM689_13870 [Aliidongia sp.]|nr:hypothetical protein [Aliidongia sp.]